MVLGGSKPDGSSGNQAAISIGVKKTIQSIKEIVRNHSDDEIYAMLQDTHMDPNETAQKLLNQDPFREVKRRRDKKKEHVGVRSSAETGKSVEYNTQWARPPTEGNISRGSYNSRNPAPGFDAGINREFRIVRDNRVNQNANSDSTEEMCQHQVSSSQLVSTNAPVKISAGVLTDQKFSASTNALGHVPSRTANGTHESGSAGTVTVGLGTSQSRRSLSSRGTQSTVSGSALHVQKVLKNNSQVNATSMPSNSDIGLYSSASDPVHVPSPDSRSAGKVGAIRRKIGVVGGRRQTFDHPAAHSPVSNRTSSAHPMIKDVKDISLAEDAVAISKSNQLNQMPPSDPTIPNVSINRTFSNSQFNGKSHHQTAGHPKAAQPSMEWKPKTSQRSAVVSPMVVEATSYLSSFCADNTTSSSPVAAASLVTNHSSVSSIENQHVIIPQHLRVPDSERTRLTFGTFGADYDSNKGFTPFLDETDNGKALKNEPSVSVSVSTPLSSSGGASSSDQGDLADSHARSSQADSPSVADFDKPTTGNNGSPSSQNIESYAEIGLVQSHSPYTSPEPPQLQNLPTLSNSSEYDMRSSYDAPFFRAVMEDNVHGQSLALSSEALSSHATSNTSSTVTMVQQQPLQQQPMAQLYPQVHISHFPNFMQYRHILSPVYAPPMAIPNYPNNPSYPHLSNGSSYVLMPGANSHITAGGIKYAASQYKPVAAGGSTGYGNYTNPAGYTINTPSSIGSATGLEDATRIKYKENNLYVPNPQAESSDIWIQTPRELPGMQSAPYYNLSGQAPHAAFMPSQHASFNAAAQSSHVQYPGLYHSPQPTSIPSSHHLVHQQVTPGFGGGVGVGVAAPAAPPQVGTYQQPQMNHLNWTANF